MSEEKLIDKKLENFKAKSDGTIVHGLCNETDILYPTGFLQFDMQNGYKYWDEKSQAFKYNMGIIDGTYNMIIGRSGCGKSTLIMQIAGNIVRPFEHGQIIHYDLEQGASNDNKNIKLLKFGLDEYEKKYTRYTSGITIESVSEMMDTIMADKVKNADKYRYFTGRYDILGEPIFKFQPTVVVIDSIPHLLGDSTFNKTLSEENNMDAAATAREMSAFLKKYTQKIRPYNINIIAINHVKPDLQVDRFASKKSPLPGLKFNEKMAGGSTTVYNLSNLIRLDDKPEKEKGVVVEHFGFPGIKVDARAAKTRTGKIDNMSSLYFINGEGFSELYSLFFFMLDVGQIEKNGAWMTIANYKDGKRFTNKHVAELMNDPEFIQALNELAIKYINENIEEYTHEKEDIKSVNITAINDILSNLC